MRLERLGDGPIIHPGLSASIGTNIQGPSLVAAPPWLENPLGRYYLYFADHKGQYIRLAYADELTGPWTVHEPGSLQLADSGFITEPPSATPDELEFLRAAYQEALGAAYDIDSLLFDAATPHIASPDVHVDVDEQRVRMYFHGLESLAVQVSRAAVSADGVRFTAGAEVLGGLYLRTFDYEGWTYGMTMPGQFVRSRDPLAGFEEGPQLFANTMRHVALWCRGAGDGTDVLDVLWTRVGDAPESILWSRVELAGDWLEWRESEPVVLLTPELAWEGADLSNDPSQRGAAHHQVNQLRDPAFFHEAGRTYVLYAGGGDAASAAPRRVI